MSGLAGGATLSIRDGEIRGINPEAFGLVIRAADAGLELDDAAVRSAFESYLDAGRLPFEALEAGATVAGGVVRVSNVTLDNTSATVFGNARIDLDAQTLDSDFSLKVDPGAEAVTGAEPEVGLVFRGAGRSGSLYRYRSFTAFLTLRAFEREVQRIEELQAEIDAREQAMEERMQLLQQEKRREDAKTRLPGDPDPRRLGPRRRKRRLRLRQGRPSMRRQRPASRRRIRRRPRWWQPRRALGAGRAAPP
ncbi:MAG: hypothetical protein HPM95_19755 [Alphaproteobacteria bacterium]|nr:hypothetical protein [Alphaproteobacteria bacterium]